MGGSTCTSCCVFRPCAALLPPRLAAACVAPHAFLCFTVGLPSPLRCAGQPVLQGLWRHWRRAALLGVEGGGGTAWAWFVRCAGALAGLVASQPGCPRTCGCASGHGIRAPWLLGALPLGCVVPTLSWLLSSLPQVDLTEFEEPGEDDGSDDALWSEEEDFF